MNKRKKIRIYNYICGNVLKNVLSYLCLLAILIFFFYPVYSLEPNNTYFSIFNLNNSSSNSNSGFSNILNNSDLSNLNNDLNNNLNNNLNNSDISKEILLNKPFYFMGDVVKIILPAEFINKDEKTLLEISLKGSDEVYRYVGVLDKEILFIPSKSGEYQVSLYSGDFYNSYIIKRYFSVLTINESCKIFLLGQELLFDLKNYSFFYENNTFIMPTYLELFHDNDFSVKKYYYKTLNNSLINWIPTSEGKYYLYYEKNLLDCFRIVREVGVVGYYNENYYNVSMGPGYGSENSNNLNSNNFNNTPVFSEKIKISDSSGNIVLGRIKVKRKILENISSNSVLIDMPIASNNTNDSFFDSTNNTNNTTDINNIISIYDTGIVYNKEVEVLPEQIVVNESYDINLELINHPVKRISINGYKHRNSTDIGIDILDNMSNNLNEKIIARTPVKAYAINLYDMEFDNASFTAIASATELWKCKDWNFTAQECYGKWELYMNLTPGMEYTVQLYPGDPGFVEAFSSNESVDIDLLAINNDTVIISWISAETGFPLKFKIMNTNGSVVVNDITVDATGDATSRIALALINSTTFIIGHFDGPAQANYFYIYNISGSLIVSQTSVDPLVGIQSDVDVCQLEDRFPYLYANADPTDQDADFRIFYNNGSVAIGETAVDTGMTPEQSNQNLVSCAVINSTRWVYAWYDSGVADDITIAVLSETGTTIVGATDIDAAVGNNAQVAATGLRNNNFAVAFYDSADQDITITVRQLSGATLTTILAATDIDTAAGTLSRVAVQEINMVNQSYFVVAWQDTSDTTIKAGIYNQTGAQVVAPFNITTTPSTTNRLLDLAGYSSRLNLGLCNGTWAIAYSNASGNTVWETYYSNGSRWDGICPDVSPPEITLIYPANNSIISLINYTLNYTVTDNRDYMLNCTLYANFSVAFNPITTQYSIYSGNYYFNVSNLNDGQYVWNVLCFDNRSNSAFAQSNFTYKQNYYLPNISNEQLNTTQINQSWSIKFNVSINDYWGISYSYITLVYPNGTQRNISLNRTGQENYLIFNDTIQIGTYNITFIWANDSLGQSNNKTTLLSFNVTASPPSEFNLLTPLNASISNNLAPNLTWQQTTEETFANYTILIDKDQNFGSPDFVYYSYNISRNHYVLDYALDANTIYYWKVIAYDIFENYRESTNYFSYITDTLAPSISLNNPLNNTYAKNSVLFNYTPSDIHNISYCELWGNWTGTFTINRTNTTINNNVENYFNAYLNDGIYLWNIKCSDIANNSRFALNNNTFIVDGTGPLVELIYPLNNTLENETNNVIFYANATDNLSNISNCSLLINNELVYTKDTIIRGEIFNITYFLNNGQYNWSIQCYDTNDNIGYSFIYNLNVDVVDNDAPFIIRNYPPNNMYISDNYIFFNYTVNDATGIENCSLYIDDMIYITNSTIINHEFNYFNITGIYEGEHNWSIECYDNTTQKNYVKTTIWNFILDLTNPEVQLLNPNNTYLNNSYVIFSYIVNDTYIDSCSLYGNFSGVFELQQTNNSPLNNNINYFYQNINDGIYVWNVLCSDHSSRSSFSSQNYTFIIDTLAPKFYNINENPINPVAFAIRNYTFNITIEEINFNHVLFENNFNGTLQNYTITSYIDNGINRTYYYMINETNALIPGNYYYAWYAFDLAGNKNSTSRTYTVTRANSTIFALIDGINNNKTINEENYANISLFLQTPGFGYVELFINSLLINNGTYGIDNIYNYTYFSIPGIYNITAVYYQTQNYSNSSDTVFLRVNDITPPNIILSAPINDTPVSIGEVNLQYIVYDESDINNCSLYINNVLVNYSNNVTPNVLQGFTVNLGIGNYTWYIDCYDIFNNYNVSNAFNFTALNASVIVVNINITNQTYQSGDTADINIITKGFFGESLNADFTAQIISGNTTIPWWNNSYMYRKELLINNTYNVTINQTIEVNITELNTLTGYIDNCLKIRMVKYEGIEGNLSTGLHEEIPYKLITGNGQYCEILLTAELNALSTTKYYVYYDNSSSLYTGNINLEGLKIQRGTTAGTAVTLTATIDSVNTSDSFVLFTDNAASSLPTIIQFTPNLVSSTQINFDRYGSGTSANISWQLVEGSQLNVQRGSGALAATAAEINFTINEVDINKSFIIVDGRVNSGTAGNNVQGYFTGRFIDNTTISLQRATTGTAATASYQVVEWKDAKVQSGNVTFATINTLQTINPVNTSRAFIVLSRRVTGSTAVTASWIYASFVNSTTINISRGAASGTATVHWHVIELPENYNVQTGLTSVGTTDINQAVNKVSMFKSFHVEKWSNTNTGTTFLNALMTSKLTNTTNIFFDKQSTTNVNTIGWFLIEEKQPKYILSAREILMGNITGNTAPLGSYNWLWNTFNKTLGLYTIIVYGYKEDFQTGITYKTFNITPDITPPNVTLISPANATIAGQGYFNFSYEPYDWNLKNCTLYYGTSAFYPNQTDTNPINNVTNNFTNIYLGVGFYYWNVLCYDSFGNSAFSHSNYTLNITGPDLYINTTKIWFSNNSLIEGTNITIYVNITNQGLSPTNQSFTTEFYKNDPDNGGIKIANLSIGILNPGETITVNISYILTMGPNNIFVLLDVYNVINETLENNNKANNSLAVPIYQYYYGNVTADIILSTSDNKTFVSFRNMTTYKGYLFIADRDSSFSFSNLQALGRTINGLPTNNDFTDIDISLNVSAAPDSIKIVWANNTDTPLEVMQFNLSTNTLYNVPIVRTSNDFVTGILWDTSDDLGNNQYDYNDKEDIIFVTRVIDPALGTFGFYSYEIKIPAALKSYKDSIDMINFYYEMD